MKFEDEKTVLLETFVSRMMQKSEALSSLSLTFQHTARCAYFVLDIPDDDSSVEQFVSVTLERILQQLNRTVQAHLTTYQGRVRGSVNWTATFKARYSGTYDPSRYVCREVLRQYDTPENQLLKFIMTRISAALETIPPILRSGVGYLPYGRKTRFVPSQERLKTIENALFRLKRNIYLRYISDISNVTEKHLVRAGTSTNEDYAELVKLYRRYHQVINMLTWEGMAVAAHRLLPMPATLEGEGDDWIRLGAALLQWSDDV